MAKAGARSVGVTGGSERSVHTRNRLVDAAIDTLRTEGYGGASARTIARRAGVNQGLIFYHFGSVTQLLLAGLDAVSERRLVGYGTEVSGVTGPGELVDAAESIFRNDLAAGYITVLAELIAGSSSTPGLGAEVAERIRPWHEFARSAIEGSLRGSPLAGVIPVDDAAYAVVALYLGMEMLSHLDGDTAPALALFADARQLASLLEAMIPTAERKDTP